MISNIIKWIGTWDWGSVADWFGGTVTTVGILLSLYWNYLNSRTKIFISANDVRFKINGNYSTTGKILIRAYNKSNKPYTIDEVGLKVIKIQNKKINKLYVPIYPIMNQPNKEDIISSYSDVHFKTNVKELTDSLKFMAKINRDDETEVLMVPYIKGPINKCFVGKTKLLINTKTFSINDGSYIWVDKDYY